MEQNGGRNSSGGILTLVVIAAAFLLLRNLIPAIAGLMMIGAVVAAIALVIFIVAIIISGLKSGEKQLNDQGKVGQTRPLSEDERQMLSRGRSTLVQLRMLSARIKDADIRRKSEETCDMADKILTTLKNDPTDIQSSRRVLNYYLPSFGEILNKFAKLENSGTEMGDMPEKVSSHIDQIKEALRKQYNNLFEDDKLDMTVEMEAMKLAFKRDGLIDGDVTAIDLGTQTIDLTI